MSPPEMARAGALTPRPAENIINRDQAADSNHGSAPRRAPVIERDLPGVAAWLDERVAAALGRDLLPILGSREWFEAGDEVKLASFARYGIGTLGELDPAVIAARLAAEIDAGRRDQATITRQASKAISGAGDWGNLARYPSRTEMIRRRAIRATPLRCGQHGCAEVVTVEHPLPVDVGNVRCGRHRGPEGTAA